MLSFVQLCSGCWTRPRPQEFLPRHGRVPGSFAWTSWSREQICLASSALISINKAPAFCGGQDDQISTSPHLRDGCKMGAGGSLVPPTRVSPPSARWFWKPPSPNVLTRRGWPRLQWVPTWVAMGSGWVGTQWVHPRETPVLLEPSG